MTVSLPPRPTVDVNVCFFFLHRTWAKQDVSVMVQMIKCMYNCDTTRKLRTRLKD